MGSWIIGLFSDFLGDSGGLSDGDKRRIYEIVSKAVGFTRTHISRYRQTQGDIESQVLSLIWQNAASEIKRIPAIKRNESLRDFADMLEQKSKYWSDPNGYDQTQFDEYQMRLHQVEDTLKRLTA